MAPLRWTWSGSRLDSLEQWNRFSLEVPSARPVRVALVLYYRRTEFLEREGPVPAGAPDEEERQKKWNFSLGSVAHGLAVLMSSPLPRWQTESGRRPGWRHSERTACQHSHIEFIQDHTM